MELKDVIHYYFKCWGIVYDSVTEKYENGKWALSANLLHCVMIDECKFKPILRRLSSMTYDEFIEGSKIHLAGGGRIEMSFDEAKEYKNEVMRPSVFHYLLSNHFDLFGLIDSNQAVDRDNQ